MAKNIISDVRIAGIASAVPKSTRTLDNDIKRYGKEAIKVSENIGVKKRHIAKNEQCASDLCFAASKQLLSDLGWKKNTIDVLIFVTQTPDFILPTTACTLQQSLGLEKNCAAFDINLGCSGYIYGLWLASNLIMSGSVNRALVLVGDTISKITSPQDRSVCFLFGDAGTATALEKQENAAPIYFQLGTDGAGAHNLIVPAGAFRQPHSSDSSLRIDDGKGNFRSAEDLYMNGPEIFTFVLKQIIPLLNSILDFAKLKIAHVDSFIMHQANLFMLKYIAKSLKIPTEKMLLSLEEYGNTSSASIPLTINHHYAANKALSKENLVLAGFGVGYSWGAAVISLDSNVIIPAVIKTNTIRSHK